MRNSSMVEYDANRLNSVLHDVGCIFMYVNKEKFKTSRGWVGSRAI